MKWAKNCPFQSTKIHIYVNKNMEKINQRACYNRIWSWSPMPCEKHGPWPSVTTKTSAFGLGFCLLSPSGHVFHTAWETMIKSYISCYTWPHHVIMVLDCTEAGILTDWTICWILECQAMTNTSNQGPDSLYRYHLTSIGNPIVEIRRS